LKVTVYLLLSGMILFLTSCTKDAEPLPSVSHPQGWNESTAENFHGKKVAAAGSEFCKSCHGEDYSGGESGVACSDCHTNYPHPPTWTTPGSESSHASYIKAHNWSMTGCKTCHGDDYRGGTSGVSCYNCHQQEGGPEACNTCHGNAAAPVSELANWAPPRDLDNQLDTSSPGVGAHQLHLTSTAYTSAYSRNCSLCHVEISDFNDPHHIDGEIEIVFSDVATWNGKVSPVYNDADYTCANVYCHGNFVLRRDESDVVLAYIDSLMVGNNPVFDWTSAGQNQINCSTCHNLPPTGHLAVTNCSNCHSSVVDANYNIINKNLHINGQINNQ
jgi:hypothetical protein